MVSIIPGSVVILKYLLKSSLPFLIIFKTQKINPPDFLKLIEKRIYNKTKLLLSTLSLMNIFKQTDPFPNLFHSLFVFSFSFQTYFL